MICDTIVIADLTLSTIVLTSVKKSVEGSDVSATDAKAGSGVPTLIHESLEVSVEVTAGAVNGVGACIIVSSIDTN